MASEVVITQQKCANIHVCNNPSAFVCSACSIVGYCSKACQKLNWNTHQETCHGVSTTAVFERERRLPIWAPLALYTNLVKKHLHAESQGAPQIGPSDRRPILEGHPQNGQFELFGGYPAIDVLQLATNEGVEREEPLDILFVEPDDLRDVIKTIVDLPENTAAPLNIFITDGIAARTTRNLVILLMALSSKDPDVTAECAVPFWYGPYVPKWCLPAMREQIRPFIQACCPRDQEERANMETGVARSWSFGSASLDVVVNQSIWSNASNFLYPRPRWNSVDARAAQHLF